MARERLQKLLARAGVASRRAAEAWIRAGRVTVGGRIATLGETADPACDEIRVDGEPLRFEAPQYWIVHKPRGVLCTTWDPWAERSGRRTVLDLLPTRGSGVERERGAGRGRGRWDEGPRLYPVGRLDVESEGLVLLTNDGALTQALLHPSLGNERAYRVNVRGRVDAETLGRLRTGVRLDDGPTQPWRVERCRVDSERNRTLLDLVLREGRKHQIRRALRKVGHPVLRLVRTRMGPLRLGRLPSGAARPLTRGEVHELAAHAASLRARTSAPNGRRRSGQGKLQGRRRSGQGKRPGPTGTGDPRGRAPTGNRHP